MHRSLASYVTSKSMSKVFLARIPARAFSRAATTSFHAKDVGILAMEAYVPKRYVCQEELEAYDGVSRGKYTVGLGQREMAFVDDREDINSVCLSAVSRLLERYNIDPQSVGRLEVGTETFIDKSKSTKTTLMQLFPGNYDLEGATVMNACYGGTASLLNSVAWVESREWDGRYAIMVTADIAVYEAGPARPTGGVAAVACLIGPNAPLRFVPKTRASHCADVYDFYKPNLSSEYPMVDGKLSQNCYLEALDGCYYQALKKHAALKDVDAPLRVQDAFDHVIFHSPYNKLVQQSFQRMLFNDARRLSVAGVELPDELKPLEPFLQLPVAATYSNKDLDKALKAIPTTLYDRLVGPSTEFCQRIGNSYTASSFVNLLCLVSNERDNLIGRNIGVFSYGSGAIATLYTLHGEKKRGQFSLSGIADTADMRHRLDSRRKASVDEFVDAMALRVHAYGREGHKPIGAPANVNQGDFFLSGVTPKHHRSYAKAH